MNLRTYIDIILRRKWVVVITVVLTMAVVIAGTWLMKPSYTATATLRIATASYSATYQDYSSTIQLINTYIIIATSQPLLDELDKQLNISKPPKISVESIAYTELISISVEDHDPTLAVNAANTLGDILISQASEFYSGAGKPSSEILKIQVDQAESDLNQARVNYNLLTVKNPPNQAAISAAGEEVDLKQQIYNSLLSQYEQLRVREAAQANLISVVNPAVFPEAPSKPNKVLYLGLGFIISLISGFGLVLIFENLDTTLFSSEQIIEVARLPMLGRIPTGRNKKIRNIPLNGDLYTTEAFLRLRTTLLKNIEDTSCKTLLITSALQGEGKSTIISGLSYVLSQAGKKVVLVDGDFRLASIHKINNIPNKTGFSDYLQGKVEVEKITRSTIFPGLSIITSGRSTKEPVNLLSSDRLKILLADLRNKYDFVLIDSPSVLAVTDACIIAPLVDGVLVVVKRAFIGKEKLAATLEQLASIKSSVIGLIINGENISENYYQYRAYSQKKK